MQKQAGVILRADLSGFLVLTIRWVIKCAIRVFATFVTALTMATVVIASQAAAIPRTTLVQFG